MFRVRGRGSARLSVTLAATGVLAASAFAAAAPASADEQNPGGATATLQSLKASGPAIIHGDKGDKEVSAGLFGLDVAGGGALQTYCIDIHHPTKQGAQYQETPWQQSSLQGNSDAGKIRWILQNSFPQVNDLSKLAGAAGLGSLDDKQAAAGTQVAIWRFSDHVDVEAKDESAEKLADYLEKAAKENGGLGEPKASLSLSSPAVSGKAGEKLGPVKVSTSAAGATVTVDAAGQAQKVAVVDKAGKPVTTAVDGDELFFDVPSESAEGSAAMSVKASTTVPIGRVFTGIGRHRGSQTQILAGSSESTVEATATATWGAKDDQGPLPAVTAEKNCEKGGLDISVTNEGEKDFVFSLGGKEHTVAAGESHTAFVALKEDEAYKVEISMPDGTKKVFEGILDCKTESETGTAGGSGESSEPSSEPSPASVGGSGDESTGGAGDLAETGSSSATPVIAGIAVALVVVGGGAVFFLRKRKSATGSE